MIQRNRAYFDSMTKEKLEQLIKEAAPYLSHRAELYQRYNRKTNSNTMMGGKNVVIAFEYYIVQMAQGYIAGKSPKYSVTDQGYQESMEIIRRYNDDGATFIELVHDYLTTTAAYLYLYENDKNEIVYTRFDSRQTVAIYGFDTPPYPVALMRQWKEGEIQVVELLTDTYCRLYHDYELVQEELVSWGDIPCVAFENPDGIAIFEPAAGLIDTFENLVTNIKSMTQYNDTAKLKVVGYSPLNDLLVTDDKGNSAPNPARAEEEAALYKALALFLDKDGDVSWLLKSVDYSGILSILKQLHDLITMMTGVPNMTDQAFSNADNASALGYKLYALDQFSQSTDRTFKKGYLRLWEIITNRLNLKGANYDFRTIDITFNRNIPTDKDKSIARAVSAKNGGLVSTETAIILSDIEVDPKRELERIEQEADSDYEKLQVRGLAGQEVQNEP